MRSASLKMILSENICFRVSKEQMNFLDDLSKTYHCTIPAMLRIIIEHEMQKSKHIKE